MASITLLLFVCAAFFTYVLFFETGEVTNETFQYSTVYRSIAEITGDFPGVEMGGSWKPVDCQPKERVALILPYRNRQYHLNIFLNNIIAFLQQQGVDFSIFLIEQVT